MRIRPNTQYCVGLWHVGFERGACLGILSYMDGFQFDLLIEGEPAVRVPAPSTGILQQAFWLRCDERMYDKATQVAERQQLGALITDLRYVPIENTSATKRIAEVVTRLDPMAESRDWRGMTELKRTQQERALDARLKALLSDEVARVVAEVIKRITRNKQ